MADSPYNFPSFAGLNLIQNEIEIDPSKRPGPMQALEAENVELFHNGALSTRMGKIQQGTAPGFPGPEGAALSQTTAGKYIGTYGPAASTFSPLFVYSLVTLPGVAGLNDIPLSYLVAKFGVNTEYYSLTCQIRNVGAGSPPTLGTVIANGKSYPVNPYPIWPVNDWIPGLSGSSGTLQDQVFPNGGSENVVQDYTFVFPGDGPLLQGGTSYWIGVEAVPNSSNPSSNPWVGNGQTAPKCLAALIVAGHGDGSFGYTRYQGLNVAETAFNHWQLYFRGYSPLNAIQGVYDYKSSDVDGVVKQKVMAASGGNLFETDGPVTQFSVWTNIRPNLQTGKNKLFDFQTFKNLLFVTDGS